MANDAPPKRFGHMETIRLALASAQRDGYLTQADAFDLMNRVDDAMYFVPHHPEKAAVDAAASPLPRREEPA